MSVHSDSIQELLGADSWRLTPATMAAAYADLRWIPAPHLLKVSHLVATALKRGRARILISFPPRHGKSELFSVNTPQWILEQNAAAKVMLTGYGLDLVTDFSRRVRDNILEHKDVF
ncbi:hypothetical protein LCGC14_2312840, partial [marine sediment metagenome]